MLRIRDAARRATDHGDRVRLASTALRLLVKRERFAEAAALADSLLTATLVTSTEEAPYLAAAALTGRASLAAALARRAAPDEVIWSPEGAVLPGAAPAARDGAGVRGLCRGGRPGRLAGRPAPGRPPATLRLPCRARREAADAALLDRTRVLLFPDDRSRPTPRTRKSVDYLVLLHEAVRSHRPAEARAMMARVAEQRRDRPFGRVAVEGAIAEALAELGMGDTTAAVARLDGYLDGLGGAGIDLTERTVAAGSLVRLLALRARLADAQGDLADGPSARRRRPGPLGPGRPRAGAGARRDAGPSRPAVMNRRTTTGDPVPRLIPRTHGLLLAALLAGGVPSSARHPRLRPSPSRRCRWGSSPTAVSIAIA